MRGVLTVVVYAVLAIVVVSALVAIAVLVLPGTEQLAPAPPDRTPWALPAERAMTGPDVGRLRLPVTLRGYRFAETDAVLDRLGEEISYRDSVIATLRAEIGAHGVPAAEDRGDGPLVEMGETPEETEYESAGLTSPQAEVEVETVDVGEGEAVEAVEAVRIGDDRSQVELDDEPPDLELPDGPAPRS